MSANLELWARRLARMKACKTVAQLVNKHGEPSHKTQQAGFEIWHYPQGVAEKMLYSIHVTVRPGEAPAAYMFIEPTDLPNSPSPPERWQRWAGAFALVCCLFLGYLSVYKPIVDPGRHAQGISFSTMASICLPVLLYVGLVLTILGEKSARILGVSDRESRAQLVVALVLVILGFLLFLWVGNVAEKRRSNAAVEHESTANVWGWIDPAPQTQCYFKLSNSAKEAHGPLA